MMIRAAHIPNAMCIVRMLLVVPIVWSLLTGRFLAALMLIFLAGVTDGLDGFLAKHYDWRSRLGGILDPLADKLLLVSVFLTLTGIGLAPVWLAAVAIGRDLVIVAGGLTYQYLIADVEPEPSRISKLNTVFQLLFVLFVIANQAFAWPPRISILVIGAGVLFTSVVSGLDYVLRWSSKAIAAGSRPHAG
jgi:cardiolipin synthase